MLPARIAAVITDLRDGVVYDEPTRHELLTLVSDEVDGATRYVALTDILGAEDAFTLLGHQPLETDLERVDQDPVPGVLEHVMADLVRHDLERELVRVMAEGRLTRRQLLERMGALGVTVALAPIVAACSTVGASASPSASALAAVPGASM